MHCWFYFLFFHPPSHVISHGNPVDSGGLCVHYSGGINPHLLVDPPCYYVQAGNAADSRAVGDDMCSSDGANCFYWIIMGGCRGWLTGTHPQPSIWRGLIWTQHARCTIEAFSVMHVSHVWCVFWTRRLHTATSKTASGCACWVDDWLCLCLILEDFWNVHHSWNTVELVSHTSSLCDALKVPVLVKRGHTDLKLWF